MQLVKLEFIKEREYIFLLSDLLKKYMANNIYEMDSTLRYPIVSLKTNLMEDSLYCGAQKSYLP